MDERTMDLAHRALDGECTPEETAELHAALQTDPALRRFQARLHELDDRLRALPEEEAPEGMRPAILDSIRPKTRHAQLGPLPRWRRDLALFAAGAVAMFLIGFAILRPPLPSSDGVNAVGTLLPVETTHSEDIRIGGETLGELRWSDSGGEILFELHWSADAPALLELEIDPEAPTLLRVRSEGREASIPLVGGASPGL